MSIVLKALSITVAIILVICILATVAGFGTKLVQYTTKQGFDWSTAAEWSWNEYIEWLKSIWPFVMEAEEQTIPMANQYINVVACTDL